MSARPLALAAVALAAGCSISSGDYFGIVGEPKPGHLRWCNSGEPEYLDPALVTSTTGVPIVEVLFDGLAVHGPSAEPVPGLAESWEIGPQLRRFTFQLRKGARWSNRREIVASDFRYHIVRILHPTTASRNAESHWNLKGGELFTAGRIKQLLEPVGGLSVGTAVEVFGWQPPAGAKGELFEEADEWKLRKDIELTASPGSGSVVARANKGVTVEVVALDGKYAQVRHRGKSGWATQKAVGVPLPDSNVRTSGSKLALRDFGRPAADAYATVEAGARVTVIERREGMSYVFHPEGDGVYGWVETALLTGQPHGNKLYSVRQVKPEQRVGRTLDADPEYGPTLLQVPGKSLLMLPEVLGVRTPDDHTLVLETWGPVPYMVNVIASRGFRPAPREAVSRRPKRWTFPEHIVTSGPFHLDAWVERDYMRLSKSKSYWNQELPKLDKITIYSMNDQGANANYYYRGHCDAVTSNNIPTSYLPFVNGARRPSGKPFKDYKAAPYLGSYFYIFNTEKLDNVHLRRALSHAIDRRPLPKILHGGQIPTHQYVPGTPISQLSAEDRKLCGVEEDDDRVAMIVEAGKLCYVPPAGPRFDLAKAKEELALAKKQMGKRFPDKISLKFNSGVEGHKLIAEYIQHEWQDKLDITIELNVQEWKTYLKATKGGEYQVGRMGWIGSYLDPEQNYMKNFKCDNPQNRPRWCSEKFDALFKRIEATADRRERLRMLAEAEEMMISEAPIMPLYVYTQHHLQKPYVKGLKVNLADRVLFQYVTLDAGWKARAE